MAAAINAAPASPIEFSLKSRWLRPVSIWRTGNTHEIPNKQKNHKNCYLQAIGKGSSEFIIHLASAKHDITQVASNWTTDKSTRKQHIPRGQYRSWPQSPPTAREWRSCLVPHMPLRTAP
jgi:hypothetical protein